jgi:maltose/moltooligosaccharide transporter
VGYIFPYVLTFLGVSNVAGKGVVPNSVIFSFYVGAAILILCVLYTTAMVKEYPPQQGAIDAGTKADVDVKAMGGDGAKGQSVTYLFLSIGLVQFFCWAAFMYMWTYTNGSLAEQCWGTTDVTSEGYQSAGNWVGVSFFVQAIGSMIWAPFIPMFKNLKVSYVVSLLIGAVGFISMFWITNEYVVLLSFLLVGAAWAAMLALPFTLFTNALQGHPRLGTYLGLFNCTICIPQIVAAIMGGFILRLVGDIQVMMLVVAGILLAMGAISVKLIKTR